MADSVGDAEPAPVRLLLEHDGEPVVLRFAASHPGAAPQPLIGDEEPPPRGRAQRFLQQAAEEVKQLAAEALGEDATKADERTQALRELQQQAVDSLRRTVLVTELLRRKSWGLDNKEQAEFLVMKKVMPAKTEADAEMQLHHRTTSFSCFPQELRKDGATVAAATRHVELESALLFLRKHWLIHSVGNSGNSYAVEIWNQKEMLPADAEQPPGSLAGKYLAFIRQHPQLGTCVNFSSEFTRLMERRHRLAVRFLPLLGADGTDAAAALPAPPRLASAVEGASSRAAGIHAALLEAQEALVDRAAFGCFRESLAKDAARRACWHVLQESSVELSFVLSMGESCKLIKVVVGYGPERSEDEGGLLSWLAELARLWLREAYIELLEAKRDAPEPVAAVIGKPAIEPPALPDLFDTFANWVERQLQAAEQYRGGDHGGGNEPPEKRQRSEQDVRG